MEPRTITGATRLIAPATLADAVQTLVGIWERGEASCVDESDLDADRVASAAAVRVSLRGLDRITHFDRENATLTAEAGASIDSIRYAAGTLGLWCPALRWLPGRERIGQAVAGGHGFRSRGYGAVGDHVLGTRFAAPAVGMVRHGGMAIKNASGYNLSAAMVGSRGLLGVLLEVTLRLVPRPAHQFVKSLRFADAASAWRTARELTAPAFAVGAINVDVPLSGEYGIVRFEFDDVSDQSGRKRERTLLERATGLGGAVHSEPIWPPEGSPTISSTEWLQVDSGTLPDVARILVQESQRRGCAGWLMAEATGGGLKLLVTSPRASASDLSRTVSTGEAEAVARLRHALKNAFDPSNLLCTSPAAW